MLCHHRDSLESQNHRVPKWSRICDLDARHLGKIYLQHSEGRVSRLKNKKAAGCQRIMLETSFFRQTWYGVACQRQAVAMLSVSSAVLFQSALLTAESPSLDSPSSWKEFSMTPNCAECFIPKTVFRGSRERGDHCPVRFHFGRGMVAHDSCSRLLMLSKSEFDFCVLMSLLERQTLLLSAVMHVLSTTTYWDVYFSSRIPVLTTEILVVC